jgi:hypothetical protein
LLGPLGGGKTGIDEDLAMAVILMSIIAAGDVIELTRDFIAVKHEAKSQTFYEKVRNVVYPIIRVILANKKNLTYARWFSCVIVNIFAYSLFLKFFKPV